MTVACYTAIALADIDGIPMDPSCRLSGDGTARDARFGRRAGALVGVPVCAVPVAVEVNDGFDLACVHIVWLAYGMRLVSGTLLQVGPELEEAARTAGPTTFASGDVTVPLIKYGMLASWLLVFLIFVREYSTGIYLLGPGTEVIGRFRFRYGVPAPSIWCRDCMLSTWS